MQIHTVRASQVVSLRVAASWPIGREFEVVAAVLPVEARCVDWRARRLHLQVSDWRYRLGRLNACSPPSEPLRISRSGVKTAQGRKNLT